MPTSTASKPARAIRSPPRVSHVGAKSVEMPRSGRTATHPRSSLDSWRPRTRRARAVSPEEHSLPTPQKSSDRSFNSPKAVHETAAESSPSSHRQGQQTSHDSFLQSWLHSIRDVPNGCGKDMGKLLSEYAMLLEGFLSLGPTEFRQNASLIDILSKAEQVIRATYDATNGATFELQPYQEPLFGRLEHRVRECQARLNCSELQPSGRTATLEPEPSRPAAVSSDESSGAAIKSHRADLIQPRSKAVQQWHLKAQEVRNCHWPGCSFASNLYRLKTHILCSHPTDEAEQDAYTCLWKDTDFCLRQFNTLYGIKKHVWLDHLDYDEIVRRSRHEAIDDGLTQPHHEESDKTALQWFDDTRQSIRGGNASREVSKKTTRDSADDESPDGLLVSGTQRDAEHTDGMFSSVKSSIFGALNYLNLFKLCPDIPADEELPKVKHDPRQEASQADSNVRIPADDAILSTADPDHQVGNRKEKVTDSLKKKTIHERDDLRPGEIYVRGGPEKRKATDQNESSRATGKRARIS